MFKVFQILKILCCLLFFSVPVNAQNYVRKQYVFFLHNKFLEDHNLEDLHPKYGHVAYRSILKKLQTKNTVVISEKRRPNTDPKVYAQKVVSQIDSLRNVGIPFKQISVIGISQGGYIAQYISYYAKNSELKFVIIGASFKNDSMNEDNEFRLYGKILSIIEKTDKNAEPLSRQMRFNRSSLISYKETTLNTGLQHGFLFKDLDDWMKPSMSWLGLD